MPEIPTFQGLGGRGRKFIIMSSGAALAYMSPRLSRANSKTIPIPPHPLKKCNCGGTFLSSQYSEGRKISSSKPAQLHSKTLVLGKNNCIFRRVKKLR